LNSPDHSSLERRSLSRARQALRCLPFRLAFYRRLDASAISSQQLAADPQWSRYTRRYPDASRVEDDLIWLIQLGVLRREVDGQGLTERVRLTPLGREVLSPWNGDIPAAGPLSRVGHWLRRHRPRL
jgi:hypothetical protein